MHSNALHWKNPRLTLACLVGLLAGLGGETLLLLERQSWRIEQALREDFRVVLFLAEEPEAAKRTVLQEKLLALPGVEEARYVSKQEALAALRRADPALVEAVSALGDNPLEPAFEVQLAPEGLSRIRQWLASAQSVADWADVRYKQAQVEAILQAEFFGHYINLALSAVVCAAALLALAGLWLAARRGRPASALGGLVAAASAAGAAAGAGLAAMMALPMRLLGPWWAWPTGARQAALVAGAAVAGWVLCGPGD